MPPPRTLFSTATAKRRRSVMGNAGTPMQMCTCSSSCLVRSVTCGAGCGLGSASAARGGCEFREPLGDQIYKLLVRQMAGGGDDQIIRRIAVSKPRAQSVAVESGNCFGSSQDRFAERVRRPKILREEFVDEIFGIVLGHANFFQDDGFFAVNFVFGEFRLENHVREDVEGFGKMFIQDAGIEADHFLGGEGVEHAADAVHFAGDIFRGAPRGSLEDHVLDEMRNAVDAGRLAARTGTQPDSHGNGMDVFHRLGDDDEAVRKHMLLHLMIRVWHVSWYCGTAQQ